ncbi:MAG: sialidase family protein [Planctomycetia bacterium]|nr:sialidase family protein [Planctomycetia bacterium]
MKILQIGLSVVLFVAFCVPTFGETAPPVEGGRTVLDLPPVPDNPRNSEGDFVRLKNGDILLAYSQYYGKSNSDHAPAFIAGRISHDNGETWGESFKILEKDGGLNLMSVSLLRLKDGRIAMFYLRKFSLLDNRPFVCFSSDEAKTWTKPQPCILEDEVGYYVVNNSRVVELSDGSVVIPCAHHTYNNRGGTNWSAEMVCYISTDGCKTFQRSGVAKNPDGSIFQEPGVMEMEDGSLLMIIRTNAGCQYLSRSKDGGRTWTTAEKSKFVSPLSPARISMMPGTNKIIAIWNESPKERNPLTIATLTQDLEFIEKWTLDEAEAGVERRFCYPALLPLGDGEYIASYCAGMRKNSGLDTLRVKKFKLK